MNRQFQHSIDSNPALNWRVLGLLNLYRVLAPLVLLALYPLGSARGFAVDVPQLFFGSTLAYLCFGLGSIIVVRRRLASVYIQTILQATVDLTLLMLILHACGGIASGLGLLLLLPVGGLAFLLPPRSALFLAAIAAIAVLADTIWQQLSGHTDIVSYATAGLLGIVLFAIAAAASFVASRMRESEISPSYPNTSCSICVKACWWSTPGIRFASSTNRRRKFSATTTLYPERW